MTMPWEEYQAQAGGGVEQASPKPWEEYGSKQAEPSALDKVKDFGMKTIDEAAFIGDLVLNLPSMVVGAGAFPAAELMGLASGESHKEASVGAAQITSTAAGFISDPLQKALRGLGLAKQAGEEPGKVEALMEKAGDLIGTIGQRQRTLPEVVSRRRRSLNSQIT